MFVIYNLGKDGKEVRSADVARVVGVSKPSTVKMMQRLIEDQYIIKEAYGSIILTAMGIKKANELYTPSVIIQHFLQTNVGVSENPAKNDAMTIVIQVSEESIEKLVQYVLNANNNIDRNSR